MDISASLPDPKGRRPLLDHLPTVSIAEANKEVFKAVAEAKEPQKKGSCIKVTQQKLLSLLLLMEIAIAKGSWWLHTSR